MAQYTVSAYCTGVGGTNYEGKLVINETVNTASNTSDITWSFSIWPNFSGSGWSFQNNNRVQIDINGTNYVNTSNIGHVYFNGNPPASASNPFVLATGSVNGITHNSDGTKSIAVYALYQQTGGGSSNQLQSIVIQGTVTLTTIARASAITSLSNATVNSNGGSTTLGFTPLSNTFYYKLLLTCGNWSNTTTIGGGYTAGTARTASVSIAAGIADYITNAKTATVTGVLITYSSSAYSTEIGRSASKTFTVTLGTGFNPTVTLALTWYSDFNDQHLCNRSYLRAAPTFTGNHGSTASSYAYSIKDSSNNVVQTGSGSTWTSGVFTAAGNYTVTVTVTDSRGNTGSATSAAFALLEYNKATFASYSGQRGTYSNDTFTPDDTNGTALRITYAFAASTGVSGNSATIEYRYTVDGVTSYWATLPASPAILTSPTFDVEKEYVFELRIYDTVTGILNATAVTITVSSASFPLDFLPSGNGAAFGKVATLENFLDVKWNLHLDGFLHGGADSVESCSIFPLPCVPYSLIEPNHVTTDYMKALIKWICAHYPDVDHGLWVGLSTPNSVGITMLHIYNTSNVDTDGYPQYATLIYFPLSTSGAFNKCGFYNYSWYWTSNSA